MSPHDAKLWSGLVMQALRLNGRSVRDGVCPRSLMQAAQKVNGSRKKRRAGAAAPLGHRHEQSPYMRLVRLVRLSRVCDGLWRQSVLDCAYAVRADMEAGGWWGLGEGEASQNPPSGQGAGFPPKSEISGGYRAGTKFRADIDG